MLKKNSISLHLIRDCNVKQHISTQILSKHVQTALSRDRPSRKLGFALIWEKCTWTQQLLAVCSSNPIIGASMECLGAPPAATSQHLPQLSASRRLHCNQVGSREIPTCLKLWRKLEVDQQRTWQTTSANAENCENAKLLIKYYDTTSSHIISHFTVWWCDNMKYLIIHSFTLYDIILHNPLLYWTISNCITLSCVSMCYGSISIRIHIHRTSDNGCICQWVGIELLISM